MAIVGIPNTRVSDIFVRQRLLAQVQSDQTALLRLESQLSSGYRFDVPSQDPVAAQRVMSLQRLLKRKNQMQTNLASSQSYLSASDSALSQVSGLINDVRGNALSVVGTTATDTQRRAVAQQVEQAIVQLIDTANTQFRGRYLFAGSDADVRPFQCLDGGVVSYDGDEKRLTSFANVDLLVDTNVPGNEVFGAISEAVRGTAELQPVLTFDTKLADLRGGQGVSRGSIAVSDGHNTSVIDLSGAETIGDVARLIRASPPEGNAVDVEIGARGLTLEVATGELRIAEVGGTTALDLGILTAPDATDPIVIGTDLDPALRGGTRLDDILGSRARAVLRPADPDNDLIVQADHNGDDLNGVTVSLVDDGSVDAGGEIAVYDAVAQTLTVYVDDHRTTGRQVVDAINKAHDADPATMPFTAGLDPLDSRNAGQGAVDSSDTPAAVTHDGSGTDFDRDHGLEIVNGPYSETIDLSEAVTIEDLLNAINGSNAGLLAAINETATGIDVRTRLSGADFAIGENGGATATQLGIRTFRDDTLLESLNLGYGVASRTDGTADFTITRNDGVSFDISVHGAKTIRDVIDLINNNPVNADPALGVAVVARLAAFGNGIELVDSSVGANRLTVTRDNNSPAAIDLGLLASGQESRSSSTSGADAEPDVLTGRDVNPQETEGLFTALVRLQQALLANDERGIQRSMAMLDHASTDMTFARAELGARQQSLDVHQTRLDTEDVQMQQDLSQAYDVDLAQVISDLTARQAALQASLKTIATMAQMTLLNFL